MTDVHAAPSRLANVVPETWEGGSNLPSGIPRPRPGLGLAAGLSNQGSSADSTKAALPDLDVLTGVGDAQGHALPVPQHGTCRPVTYHSGTINHGG